MGKKIGLAILMVALCACAKEPEHAARQAPEHGLKKLRNATEEQIQQLRNAGAEIIVQEKDYIIVSTENVAQTLDLRFEAISESDLVQRFVHVLLTDRSELQQVVNSGMDYWELKGDTVVGRAFDVQIEQLRKEGFTVDIIAQNASAREEK